MKEQVKCQEQRDGGATRVRGWHNYYDCTNNARYKVKKWGDYIERVEAI
jgi:hypothetical protein